MKQEADVRTWMAVTFALVLSLCASAGQNEAGLTVTVSPDTIYPGDIVRLEVTRRDAEFGRFELEVQQIENLYLLGIEESPVTVLDGTYLQKETWIFQPTASGEILLDGMVANTVSGDFRKRIPLSPITISVLPYREIDTDESPIEWGSLSDERIPTNYGIYILMTCILLIALLIYLYSRTKKEPLATVPEHTPLLSLVLADLHKGILNPDSLHRYYEQERDRDTFPPELKKEIEGAIYANRGNPLKLAETIRKGVGE